MALSPVAFIAPNYRDFKNYWMKAYEQGTTTPISMALDSDGDVTVAKLELNADGFLESAGGALVIPYIDGFYDAWLFPTEALADANDTTNAEQVADNILGVNGLLGAKAAISSTLAIEKTNTSVLVGTSFIFSDRVSAIFDTISGTGTANGKDKVAHDTLDLTFVLRTKKTDPRAWGAGATGTDVTSIISEMLLQGQNIYAKAQAGETLAWEISSELNIITDGQKVKMTKSVSFTQVTNNTFMFRSNGIDNITMTKLNLIGVGVSDDASTLNADAETNLAQAKGMDLRQGSGILVESCNVTLFKNAGIQASYCSNVRILKNTVAGTAPDPDIDFGDTTHQQFGIQIYAQNWAEEGEASNDFSATPHDNGNINISGNDVTATAIAINVFPGYHNVVVVSNITHGTLTQHSCYLYSPKGTVCSNNTFTAIQNVGIKINVRGDTPDIKEDIIINGNTLSNCSAPCISIETPDKSAGATPTLFQSGMFLRNLIITNNTLTDFENEGIIVACSRDVLVEGNTLIRGNAVASKAGMQFRSASGLVTNNKMDDLNFACFAGKGSPYGDLTIKDNECDNYALSANVAALGLTISEDVIGITAFRWCSIGNLFRNGTVMYICVQSGETDSNLPTGGGDGIVSGTAIFDTVSSITNVESFVNMEGNKFKNTKGDSLSQTSISLDDVKFNLSIVNNEVDPSIGEAQIQGTIRKYSGNNFVNTSASAMVFVERSVGTPGNVYIGLTPPTSGTYEKGDLLINEDPIVGGIKDWTCVVRGTSGGVWEVSGQVGVAAGVGATPLFVGQFAVVGPLGYIATGTSSSADWKQITN